MFQHQFYAVLSIIYLSLACEQTFAHCHGNNSHHSVRILQFFFTKITMSSPKYTLLSTMYFQKYIWLVLKIVLIGSYYKTSTYKCYRPVFRTLRIIDIKSSIVIKINSTIHFFSNSTYDRKSNAVMKMNTKIHQKSEQYV